MISLIPAAVMEEPLKTAMRVHMTRDPEAMRWLRLSASASWIYSAPGNGDWEKIARVVCDSEGVIGYLSASIDRDCHTVSEVLALRLTPTPTVHFAVAMRGFYRDLLRQFRSVRWSCVKGSPMEDGYRRLAERMGGRQVGEWPDYARLQDGSIRSVLWFWVPGEQRDDDD